MAEPLPETPGDGACPGLSRPEFPRPSAADLSSRARALGRITNCFPHPEHSTRKGAEIEEGGRAGATPAQNSSQPDQWLPSPQTPCGSTAPGLSPEGPQSLLPPSHGFCSCLDAIPQSSLQGGAQPYGPCAVASVARERLWDKYQIPEHLPQGLFMCCSCYPEHVSHRPSPDDSRVSLRVQFITTSLGDVD